MCMVILNFFLQIQDGKRVMDCLKKCIRITQQCMEMSVQVQLFIELLNYYVYFYERGNTNVSEVKKKNVS